MENKEIFLLVDYRGNFYSSHKSNYASMDIGLITVYLREFSFELTVRPFTEIDFRRDDFCKKYVLYTSSEDNNLYYKDFIEDILLGLATQGAYLIPEFRYFRAHHNKVFAEILRDLSTLDTIKNIESKIFGTYEELERKIERVPEPAVIKTPDSARSDGVKLARSRKSLRTIAQKVSFSPGVYPTFAKTIKEFAIARHIHIVRKLQQIAAKVQQSAALKPLLLRTSRNRKKFLVQSFIGNLDYDYKILIYGAKYYVLLRGNRTNDFRASGSGLFEYTADLPCGLLDFAKSVFESFDVPYISLDVGFDGRQFYLFEFQFICFGNVTLENSTFYFERDPTGWKQRYEEPILEREFARSVAEFVSRKEGQIGVR